MRTRPFLSLTLALALVLGQWLAVGHDTDHGLKPGTAHVCAVCVFSHGTGAAALPALAALTLFSAVQPPDAEGAGNPLAATLCTHPIRGPPTLLV